jgi:hypothetical protein
MKTYFTLILLLIFFTTFSHHLSGKTEAKKKTVVKNGEREREYKEAVGALNSKIFLVSFYSFIDKTGKMVSLEPEGNFITVNADKFMMQKSISLILNTFSGGDNLKGDLVDFNLKETKKGFFKFSFDMKDGDKILTFKAKMNNGDNIIEGSIKGKKEDREIIVSGNIQPVKSRFVY